MVGLVRFWHKYSTRYQALIESSRSWKNGAVNYLLGTRASDLAVGQSKLVADTLEARGVPIALETITTDGDKDRRTSLKEMGGIGVFAAAIRLALLDRRIHLAVHSFKDLPTAPYPDLHVACTPAREDPRDALVSAANTPLSELRPGSRVGTGSPRRAAQVLAVRPDLKVVDIRGNVPTRLARVLGADADLDAVIVAASGLARLGLTSSITEYLGFAWAPAQGALAIEVRTDCDKTLLTALSAIHDDATWRCVSAERAVLAGLKAGCAAPVGVHTDESHLTAIVAAPDGNRILRATVPMGHTVDDAVAAGHAAAEQLLGDGAETICDLHAVKVRR